MLFPELTPKVLRSRNLKKAYEDWKREDKVHSSPSGLTAHYFMYRAKQEGIPFILTYSDEFAVYRLARTL